VGYEQTTPPREESEGKGVLHCPRCFTLPKVCSKHFTVYTLFPDRSVQLNITSTYLGTIQPHCN